LALAKRSFGRLSTALAGPLRISQHGTVSQSEPSNLMASLHDPRLAEAMAAVYGQFGTRLWVDPGRTRALLSDLMGTEGRAFRAAIDLVDQAAAAGIPAAIHSGNPDRQLATLLVDRGIDPEIAVVVVALWDAVLSPSGPATASAGSTMRSFHISTGTRICNRWPGL